MDIKRRKLLSVLAAVPAVAVVAVGGAVAMGASVPHRHKRRISTQPNDPGYRSDAVGGPFDVYCNSERMRLVVMADEALGQVKCIATDAKGHCIPDPPRNDVFYHWHYGHVEIRERHPRDRAFARRHA